ncbi:MAG: glycosyltransferase family 2 protein [Candidatus Moraniibacteriota bacterium]|nr:MAG: glycosyltransferase family 2 protein [Candidatus Moranbacteria bacterium]
MNGFFIAVAIGFLFVSALWILRIFRTVLWLRLNVSENISSANGNNGVRFFVLIPVLDEIDILENTIKYFSSILQSFDGSKVIIVTTEEEYNLNYKGSGRDTVAMSKLLEKKYDNIICVHYPYTGGKMAHQVNYAVNFIRGSFQLKAGDYFALYNADSRPDSRTFYWVWRVVRSVRMGENPPQVFQQYGNYLGNYPIISRISNFLRKSILLSASLWQNRWSIGFEIPHSLDQFKERNARPSLFAPMNYCIGHGLFFSQRIYKEVGGFSEDMHNEDAIFGLQLNYYGYVIEPIPFFDVSYSPDSIKSLFFQKASWFFGPLQAFDYYFQITKNDPSVKRDRLLIFSLKLFSHAIYWIVGPSFLLFLFLCTAISGSTATWASFFLVYVCFLVVPNFLSWIIFRGKDATGTLVIFVYLLSGSFFFYMLHGLSGWLSTFRYFGFVVFNYPIRKSKTLILHEHSN